jgi:hypothetical protein
MKTIVPLPMKDDKMVKDPMDRLEKKKGPAKTVKSKSGGWIKDAIRKPGALRKSLGVKEGQKIPSSKLAKAAKAPGKLGQRARLAQTLKGFKK